MRTRRRSRSCGRPATMPSAAARWASASSTTSPSPRRMRARTAPRRVAILDFDVHHGNGTQHIFEADPHVLYVSDAPVPVLPGHRRRRGGGRAAPAAAFTVNLPLEVGAVRRGLPAGVLAIIVLPCCGSSSRPADRLGRLRRARARSARRHACHRRRLRGDDARSCAQLRRNAAAAGSSRSLEGGYDLHALGDVARRRDRCARRAAAAARLAVKRHSFVARRGSRRATSAAIRAFWKV